VPDRSTIILGGMLRLNQTKSGRKVPILGEGSPTRNGALGGPDLPLVGGVFRSISNNDIQSKLYIFVRAEVIRPTDTAKPGGSDIDMGSQTPFVAFGVPIISRENREAFEEHEREFQNYQDWPGIKPKPVEPRTILEAR
jgi:general secretion pathway protein D